MLLGTHMRDVVGSFLISPVKGWASGHALLHAGIPCPDPSEADKASGLLVFRRWGFFGNAVRYIPAAAARSSAISHPGLLYQGYIVRVEHHTLLVEGSRRGSTKREAYLTRTTTDTRNYDKSTLGSKIP